MDSEIAENSTKLSGDAPKRRWRAGHVAAFAALVVCLVQGLSARADSDSCMANISSYVAELDALLAKEKNRITPYHDLNERYFPFRDCEAVAFLEVVRGSGFIRSISYRSGQYFIRFSNDEIDLGLTYYVAEKKSSRETNTVGWLHK